jgi:hypothetical protein
MRDIIIHLYCILYLSCTPASTSAVLHAVRQG